MAVLVRSGAYSHGCAAPADPGARQHGLAPVERLDVRLLVDAKHGGVGRGRDVEAEGAGKGGGVFMPARDAGS
jgi:hypothetical protein